MSHFLIQNHYLNFFKEFIWAKIVLNGAVPNQKCLGILAHRCQDLDLNRENAEAKKRRLFDYSLKHIWMFESGCHSLLIKITIDSFNHVVQLLSHVRLFMTPWTAACQASMFYTIFWSLFKFMSIESVMPSNHLILCRPLLLLPSIFPSIRVFPNESALPIRWPKY